MVNLLCSLKVLKPYQRVSLSLHLQRVIDTITAIPGTIYPEPSRHFVNVGWGCLSATVWQVTCKACTMGWQASALRKLPWHLLSKLSERQVFKH